MNQGISFIYFIIRRLIVIVGCVKFTVKTKSSIENQEVTLCLKFVNKSVKFKNLSTSYLIFLLSIWISIRNFYHQFLIIDLIFA